MNCKIYPNYCSAGYHNDERNCHETMERYYGHKYNGVRYYVCPACRSTQKVDYPSFFKMHRAHLRMFTGGKNQYFQSRMMLKKEMLRLCRQMIHRTIVDQEIQSRTDDVEPGKIVVKKFSQEIDAGKKLNKRKINIDHVAELTPNKNQETRRIKFRKIADQETQSGTDDAGKNQDDKEKYRKNIQNILMNDFHIPPKISKIIGNAEFCPTVEKTSDFNGVHVNLTSDIRGLNTDKIIIPTCLIEKLNEVTSNMDSSKIQFGIDVDFEKEDVIKASPFSNSAVPFTNEFIRDGLEKLNEKLVKFKTNGSGWSVKRINEISFIITKTSEIIVWLVIAI